MKKTKFILPLSVVVLSFSSCGGLKNYDFVAKNVRIYSNNATLKNDQGGDLLIPLYFSEEYPQIPFIDVKNLGGPLLSLLQSDDSRGVGALDTDFKITTSEKWSELTLKRENGAYITFNADYNTVYSPSLNQFRAASYKVNPFDLYSHNTYFRDDKGQIIKDDIKVMKPTGKSSDGKNVKPGCYYIKGDDVFMDLNAYNINIVKRHGTYFMPFTTFYNIAAPTGIAIAYNGENLFLNRLNNPTEEFYTQVKGKKRGKTLIEYTYNELCRDLDYKYGLKDTHHISSFDYFCEKQGLKSYFLNEKENQVNLGLWKLIAGYIGDLHTSFTGSGAYDDGFDSKPRSTAELIEIDPTTPITTSFSELPTLLYETLPGIRKEKKILNENGVIQNPLVINGDTAIITFDHFVMRNNPNYYYNNVITKNSLFISETEPYEVEIGQLDTVALVSYANSEIKKTFISETPVKNVVIDISDNGGGAINAALFIAGWLDSAKLLVEDPLTNERAMTTYQVDVNFNKKYDEEDSIFYCKNSSGKIVSSDINLYCLTSRCSFSCGNLLPAMIEQSGKGVMIGTTSGGGACSVQTSALADGTGFNFSSNYRLCQEKNGYFTHIDKGITPTYLLTSYETIYGGEQSGEVKNNRKALAEHIQSIKR